MKKRKKHSIRKKNICHKCGQPPSERDNGMLNKYKGVWQCEECLVGGYDDEADIRERAEREVWGGSCSLGAVEDLLPPPITISIEDRDKINHMARECKVDISSREWSQGVLK